MTEEITSENTPSSPAPIVRQHTLTLNGNDLAYTSTTGMISLKDNEVEALADVFTVAYTLDGVEDVSQRPLIFVFNGGPGSASVWLHLGALGPQRVKMDDEGWMPPMPYQLIDNAYTWLDIADLVFIDPVGTGYSRSTKPENNSKYWNLQGDIESVGEIIRLYLTQNNRWSSPIFMAGESYGTTRAAGLAGHLIQKGIAFNGIMLISTILNFQTARFLVGNDLPYALFLPTYTATAWYHKRLSDDLLARPLRDVMAEVEAWAEGEYTLALTKGDKLSEEETDSIAEKLAGYTGLSVDYVKYANLRLHIFRYVKELLRDEGRTVGRLDSRFKGYDRDDAGESFDFDPSMTAITPPYTAMMNDYARRTLGYETDTEYKTLSYDVFGGWEWERDKMTDTSEPLRQAMAKNPHMKVFVGQGYYDLATPHFAAHYTLNHMGIHKDLRDNITTADYEAGHMMYLHVESLAKLKDDVVKFIEASL